jgi:uncharacterized protein YcgI (DUF1989 family)
LSAQIIPERSGVAFTLKKGELLKIIDLEGEQVSDLVCFNLYDSGEHLSSGRTFDYEETIFLTKGNRLFSNRSNIMFEILEDTVGRHDFLLAPCSAEMFRITYGHEHPHRGCFGNLVEALAPYSIQPDQIPTCFNVFMNVTLEQESGKLKVLPPRSRSGDYILIKANMDMIVGMTACSAGMTNNFRFKPIGYSIL